MATSSGSTTVDAPSDDIATFVDDLEFEGLPADAKRTVEQCFVDTFGVILAGGATDIGRIVSDTVVRANGSRDGPATIIGADGGGSLMEAALVNGTTGHSLDFDDGTESTSGHPSTPMIPAILSIGESVDASGRDMITAYVAGFESMAYIAAPINPDHFELGWHPTATFGTFGATAAAAKLLELSPARIRHALNISASLAAGVHQNNGSMTKPVHAGNAARSGVTAALLAENGCVAAPDAVSGERGFLHLYASHDGPDVDAFTELGEYFAIVDEGVHVKKYPSCYATHTSIDAATQLAAEDFDLTDIATVSVTAADYAGDVLTFPDPESGLEAKFSMEYCVAAALAHEGVGISDFEAHNIDDEAVQRIRRNVEFVVDSSLPYQSFNSTVTVQTEDGREFEVTLEEPTGTHDNPLSEAEYREKFMMCSDHAGLDAQVAESLYASLDSLRDEPSARDLLSPL